ncbi:hypothetical protein GGS23DRAFT_596144 [Durotheca rogersii]|uniref:uncharacterized protein n=1 Tax=Durotheca rogersii TaxID=419775 RepID=UPI00221E9780|nr:uncharacterized protein GGS23DRAFT_596144 [Durotheca rogersii]KAI5863637.1 hypothetical protein GGS23DRAFT_596144 [Durotheca rogersii]
MAPPIIFRQPPTQVRMPKDFKALSISDEAISPRESSLHRPPDTNGESCSRTASAFPQSDRDNRYHGNDRRAAGSNINNTSSRASYRPNIVTNPRNARHIDAANKHPVHSAHAGPSSGTPRPGPTSQAPADDGARASNDWRVCEDRGCRVCRGRGYTMEDGEHVDRFFADIARRTMERRGVPPRRPRTPSWYCPAASASALAAATAAAQRGERWPPGRAAPGPPHRAAPDDARVSGPYPGGPPPNERRRAEQAAPLSFGPVGSGAPRGAGAGGERERKNPAAGVAEERSMQR